MTDHPTQPPLLPDLAPNGWRGRGGRTAKAAAPLTTAQQLGSLIKSARDIMRKDKGLNGALDSADGDPRRKVVATVFRGTVNRMINGYLLRDVVNRINAVHFTSSAEIHTLGHLYETLLKEMRDAAGDAGEFYTPRPVIRFM